MLVLVIDYCSHDENLLRPRETGRVPGSHQFCVWVGKFLAAISAKAAAKDQLDRASTSIPLNIAEGNGNFRRTIALVFLRLPAAQLWRVLRP